MEKDAEMDAAEAPADAPPEATSDPKTESTPDPPPDSTPNPPSESTPDPPRESVPNPPPLEPTPDPPKSTADSVTNEAPEEPVAPKEEEGDNANQASFETSKQPDFKNKTETEPLPSDQQEGYIQNGYEDEFEDEFEANETAPPQAEPDDDVDFDQLSDDDIGPNQVRSTREYNHKSLKGCEPKTLPDGLTPQEIFHARAAENEECHPTGGLHALSPFTLKRVYGRLDNVPAINLTGIYSNHIVYASSNVVIIYDYLDNVQKCLQGHRNTITHLQMERQRRFIVSTDAGKRSLIIIWETMTGKPLKYFPNSHEGFGSLFGCFTGMDHVVASIGAEEQGKQTISFWNFEPNAPDKIPTTTKAFPKVSSIIRELTFLPGKPEYFAATGDRNIIFGTWDYEAKAVYLHKPRVRKAFITKHKHFSCSVWMKDGEWLVTATGAGYVVIWGPPVVLALEDPPDPTKNIREFQRAFKLCEDGITVFKTYEEYVVIGDAVGVIRFFDHEFKLLRWCRNFQLPGIRSISFNRSDSTPEFKKQFRQKYSDEDSHFPTTDTNSRVKDYSRGGTKFRQVSKTTLPRPPMPCPDFVIGVTGGDVFYYHFHESQMDRLVPGSPGAFISCDACPGSNHIAFTTARGDVQVYDFISHRLIFNDRIFAPSARVTTMKFHPFGQICTFGLQEGRISFRWNYSWKTSMPPITITSDPIVRIIFSVDGLHLAYYDTHHAIGVLKYLAKGHAWMVIGKGNAHQMSIVDLQFFIDPEGNCNRLFSLSLDRHLIEYDVDKSTEETGLFVVKITALEQTARPSAMVFEGPEDFGIDCITLANNINKLRLFSLKDERVKKTICGPVFGRDRGISRMITFPSKLPEDRLKTFIVYIVKNKLGLMDPPLDGNPHKYVAVYTHPREIIELAVLPGKQRIFTIGKSDNSAFFFEVSPIAVESSVLMGGSGIAPFYHTIKRHWGGACQDVLKDLDMLFFFLNVKRIDKITDFYRMNRNIRLCEIAAVARACGFFPSEYEVGLMMDEARRLKIESLSYSDDFSTEISFDEFVKLFVNHFYRTTDEDVEEAFKVLGFLEPEDELPFICKHDFVQYLTTEGEKISKHNFPIFFDALYDVRTPGEFGAYVKCHTVEPPESISSSSSSNTFGAILEKVEEEEPEIESVSSGSSSSWSGENDEEEDDDEEEEEVEEVEEEEEEEGAIDPDDDDDDMAKSQQRPPTQPGTTIISGETEEDEEEDDGESGEEEQFNIDDVLKQHTEPIFGDEGDEDVPEEADEDKDLVDLPEKVDLMYFLEQMIPPESQQMIRWHMHKHHKAKTSVEDHSKMDTKKMRDEKAFLNSILKQIVDPSQPVPRKLLNTLYAEYYLEHGDFSVPADIRFPGINLPGDNWYNESDRGTSKTSKDSLEGEEEDEEGEEEDEDEEEDEEGTEEDVEEQEDEEDEEDAEEEDVDEEEEEKPENNKKPRASNKAKKGKVKPSVKLILDGDEEENDEEQDDKPEEIEEKGEGSEEASSEEEESRKKSSDNPEEEQGHTTLPSTAVTGENLDEDTPTTDHEDGTSYSAPFTDHPPTTAGTGSGRPGYETDATEEMTDLENAIEQDDLEFVKSMNPGETGGGEKKKSADKKKT